MTNLFQALVRTNLQKELYTTEYKASGRDAGQMLIEKFWRYSQVRKTTDEFLVALEGINYLLRTTQPGLSVGERVKQAARKYAEELERTVTSLVSYGIPIELIQKQSRIKRAIAKTEKLIEDYEARAME